MTAKTIDFKVGDKVIYYNYTSCVYEKGIITKIGIPVKWEDNQLGVEINNSLTRLEKDIRLEGS